MKHWGLFLFVLAFAACHDDNTPEPKPDYYITPEEDKITADCNGAEKRIAVTSNCDWYVGQVPAWCTVQKVAEGDQVYLDVEIRLNDDDEPREATIPLLYRRNLAVATFTVFQSGQEKPVPLEWRTFAVNRHNDVKYDLLADNTTRSYRISAQVQFITPASKKQVFTGNLIDRRADNYKLTDYHDRYTFNPVPMTALAGHYSTKELTPAYETLNGWAQQIAAELPKQELSFQYNDNPIRYTSHRHLHLLGMGNLGLELDRLISGRSYREKEMEKRTGIIYDYAFSLFSIAADYPEKPVNETIDEELLPGMRYINSVIYGRTALLLLETDHSYKATQTVVNKIIRNEALSDDETHILRDLDIWYVYFDNFGVHTTRGGDTLIGRFIEEMNTLDVIPLGFTVNRLSDQSVSDVEITFDLP